MDTGSLWGWITVLLFAALAAAGSALHHDLLMTLGVIGLAFGIITALNDRKPK